MSNLRHKGFFVRLCIYTAVAVVAVGAIWWLESKRAERRASLALQDPVPRLLWLKEKAHGPARPHEYLPGKTVRVVAPAPARRQDNTWVVLAANSLLEVERTRMENDEPWISVFQSKKLPPQPLVHGTLSAGESAETHATFLELWEPVTADDMLEIMAHKLWSDRFFGLQRHAVRGFLRNISAEPLRDCVVTATFLGKGGKVLSVQRSEPLAVSPQQIVQFTTQHAATTFETVSVRVDFTDAAGRRHQSQPVNLAVVAPPEPP